MRAADLIEEVERVGGVVVLDGEHIAYEIPAKAKPLLDELRAHKFEVIALLREIEAADSVRCFGQRHARLFPLLGRKVLTPAGVGTLWQVFAGQSGVLLDRDAAKVVTYFPTERIGAVSSGLP